ARPHPTPRPRRGEGIGCASSRSVVARESPLADPRWFHHDERAGFSGALAWAMQALRAAGVEEASLEAQLLLAHATGEERATLLAHPERRVAQHEEAAFRELVEQRIRRVPLAYLLGWREFYGRRFLVGPDV